MAITTISQHRARSPFSSSEPRLPIAWPDPAKSWAIRPFADGLLAVGRLADHFTRPARGVRRQRNFCRSFTTKSAPAASSGRPVRSTRRIAVARPRTGGCPRRNQRRLRRQSRDSPALNPGAVAFGSGGQAPDDLAHRPARGSGQRARLREAKPEHKLRRQRAAKDLVAEQPAS